MIINKVALNQTCEYTRYWEILPHRYSWYIHLRCSSVHHGISAAGRGTSEARGTWSSDLRTDERDIFRSSSSWIPGRTWYEMVEIEIELIEIVKLLSYIGDHS